MDFGIKVAVVAFIGFFVYREILKSITRSSAQRAKPKAGFLSLGSFPTVSRGYTITKTIIRSIWKPYRSAWADGTQSNNGIMAPLQEKKQHDRT